MTDEIDNLAADYVTSFGDGAEARIGDDISWSMTMQDWEETQRLQRAQQRIQALRAHAEAVHQDADLAERQARFIPGLAVRSLDVVQPNLVRLISA